MLAIEAYFPEFAESFPNFLLEHLSVLSLFCFVVCLWTQGYPLKDISNAAHYLEMISVIDLST